MEAIEEKAERQDKRTSAVLTAVLALLMLLLLFIPLFYPNVEEDTPSGIQIALGEIDVNPAGNDTGPPPTAEETPEETADETDTDVEESTPASEPEPAEAPSTEPTPDEVATDPNSENIQLDKEKEEQQEKEAEEKAKAEAEAKAKAEAEAKAKAEAEAKKKAEEERKRKEKELEDKKDQFSDFLGGGDGEDNTAAGSEEGEPNDSNITSPSIGTGDIGGGLSGRDVVGKPAIQDNSQQTGKVIIRVCVDNKGKVISTEYTQAGSTTNDPGLVKTAINGAKGYQFSESNLDKQCGTITFDFKVQ